MLGKLLLVEGTTDKYAIERIYEKTLGSKNKFSIQAYKEEAEGIEALLKKLPIIIKGAESTDILGIVVDADVSAGSRWQRIKQILQSAGYVGLDNEFPNGLIIPPNDILPRFGLWIMPNNQDSGILESFIQTLIHDNDQLQPKVSQMLQDLKTSGLRLFTDAKEPKAFIHTWLAWQESPGLSFGSALNNRIFDTNSDLCNRFTQWLETLYNV